MRQFFHDIFLVIRSPDRAVRIPVINQFIKFSLVGVVNTATSTVVYTIMSRPLHQDPLIANGLAFVVASGVSYLLNRAWTFASKTPPNLTQYSRFILVATIGLVLSETLIFILHHLLGLSDFLAFFIAVGVVLFWNFTAQRMWTFARTG